MARILFLTQVLPYPLDAGPKTRAYYVLRYLAQADHQVTLLSFVRDSDRPQHIEHLRAFCHEVHTVPMRRSRLKDLWHLARSFFTSTPFLIARDWVPAMDEQVNLESRISDFEFVHADQLWMAPYAESISKHLHVRRSAAQVQVFEFRNTKLVLDQHNAVFQIPRRLAQGTKNPLVRSLLSLEARKLARYEAEAVRRFDEVVWVTAEDREAATELQVGRLAGWQVPESQSSNLPTFQPVTYPVIPICIDAHAEPVIARKPGAHRVTFLGGLHWPPNAEGVLWFAREVWPLVHEKVPDAILTIIGKSPPKQFRISNFEFRNVEVTDYVEDLAPYLAETAVFVVPLHAGGGMRVKILDAWRWGLPVVSTTIGAEGIRVAEGENLLLADTAEGFAQAVLQVLGDGALAQRLARGGRATVEQAYHWETIYRAWDDVYGE